MKKYTYWDNSQVGWVGPSGSSLHGFYKSVKIYECMAESIMEADKKLEKELAEGTIKLANKKIKVFDMNKLNHISCSIGE